MLQPIIWTNEYFGQSPGDLENKKNGFAGRFSGYDVRIKNPYDKLSSNLPIILIVGDSIISDICVSFIKEKFKGIANVNFLQQPHHCKNITCWLENWKINKWQHYHCIFWFDGMHGFPERVTETEFLELTPILVSKINKNIKNILWCNCTPIPENMPQGNYNSIKGPNSKQQILTDESVRNRNKSIQTVMNNMNIECLDLYHKIKPIQHLIQKNDDIHFTLKGQIIIGNHIYNKLKVLFFK